MQFFKDFQKTTACALFHIKHHKVIEYREHKYEFNQRCGCGHGCSRKQTVWSIFKKFKCNKCNRTWSSIYWFPSPF